MNRILALILICFLSHQLGAYEIMNAPQDVINATHQTHIKDLKTDVAHLMEVSRTAVSDRNIMIAASTILIIVLGILPSFLIFRYYEKRLNRIKSELERHFEKQLSIAEGKVSKARDLLSEMEYIKRSLAEQSEVFEAHTHENNIIEASPEAKEKAIYDSAEAERHYLLGTEKAKLNELEGAIEAFTQAIEINPYYAAAYNRRGSIKKKQNDSEGAIEDFSKAIEISPNYAATYNNRGTIYNKIGKLELAMADFNKAIELSPNFADAYNKRGNTSYRTGDYKACISDLDKALELNPGFVVVYNKRGLAKMQLGDVEGAIADYNQAITLSPNFAAAYFLRAKAKARMGDNAGSEADFERARTISPNFAMNAQ